MDIMIVIIFLVFKIVLKAATALFYLTAYTKSTHSVRVGAG